MVKGLNPKQLSEVKVIVSRKVNAALGDMAEYLNYLNDRIEVLEEKLEIPQSETEIEIATRYGFEASSRRKGDGSSG